MARESKRRREGRRFGRPERLADRIFGDIKVSSPAWMSMTPDGATQWFRGAIAECRQRIATWPIVVIDDVSTYFYSYCEKTVWDLAEDFPNCRPPFESMFLESVRPAIYRDESGARPFDPSFPLAWGIFVEAIAAERLPRRTGDPAIDESLCPMLEISGIRYVIRLSPVIDQRGYIMPMPAHYFVPIDETGRVLGKDKFVISGAARPAAAVGENFTQLVRTAMLAISFMNCKNVSLQPVDPDPALNRARRRNGLRPFVRYHTIDIEPMKRVLRTEGRSETVGLKKALHICRGHFATYTEERPLFGRQAGTFWVPAHVRGSTDQGVVVSDYHVGASATHPRADADTKGHR